MAPRDAGGGACGRDAAGDDSVAEEALGLVQLAGVDVGLAGVAGGVDQEIGFLAAEQSGERGGVGVVEFGPAQRSERDAPALQQGLIGRANVTGTAEEIDHGNLD